MSPTSRTSQTSRILMVPRRLRATAGRTACFLERRPGVHRRTCAGRDQLDGFRSIWPRARASAAAEDRRRIAPAGICDYRRTLVAPSRESFRPSDRQVNAGAIPNRAAANQRFFSNTRQGATGQAERPQGGVNRGGNTSGTLPQQNAARPGFRSFGSNNSGNTNRAPASEQAARPSQGNHRRRRTAVCSTFVAASSVKSVCETWLAAIYSALSLISTGDGRTKLWRTRRSTITTQLFLACPPAESTRQFQNNSRGSSVALAIAGRLSICSSLS